MKLRSLTLTVIVCQALLCALAAPAQAKAPAAPDAVIYYAFAASLDVYSDISSEAGYTASIASEDDDSAVNIALPFTFTYDGVDYTTGRISVNGWLEMGQTYTGAGYTNALDSTMSKPLLAPLWDDLYLTDGEIGYVTLYSAPNRVFVVQWTDVLWYYDSGTPQDFQVRLYETSNIIQFVYGAMNAPGDPTEASASIGINDAAGGSGHFLSITPASGTSDTVSSTTANNAIDSAAYLPAGKTYTFTPVDPSAPPLCAVNMGPADGASDVFLDATLNWRSGGGQVDRYHLYFGADNPPTNGEDLGAAVTYDPTGNLMPNTTYYWQVVPENTHGPAVGCPVWSFTTGASSYLLSESFTGAAFPPSGWTVPAGGACAWSRVTAGSYPTQAPYSLPAEARFNSYDCASGGYKQLLLPALDFSAEGEYRLAFWMYHDTLYTGDFPDRLQVQVSLDGGSSFVDVGAEIDRYTGADGWAQHEIDLTDAVAGQAAVMIVFKGISGYGSNMFLDDVQVIQTLAFARPNCATLSAPADGATGVALLPTLKWASGGGVPAGYRLSLGVENPPTSILNTSNLGKVFSYTHTPPLLAASTQHYWQVIPYNSFGEALNCPVWSFTTGPAPIAAFPYVEGFEGGAAGWASGGTNSSWELGTPAGETIQGASTGSSAWMTNLDGDYNNDELSYVQSPAFDFAGMAHPYVKFDLWWESEYDYDGATLQASVDGGATWEMVGSDSWAFNGYNPRDRCDRLLALRAKERRRPHCPHAAPVFGPLHLQAGPDPVGGAHHRPGVKFGGWAAQMDKASSQNLKTTRAIISAPYQDLSQ